MTLDEQIAALEQAIASGVRRFSLHTPVGRRETEYHSLKEMRAALAELKARRSGRPNITLASF